MSRDDGGSAFPVAPQSGSPEGCLTSGSDGMTLRDYFAAHAIDAAFSIEEQFRKTSPGLIPKAEEIAYRIADRMLKVRKEWADSELCENKEYYKKMADLLDEFEPYKEGGK